MQRLVFIRNHVTERGDCYRGEFVYNVEDDDLADSLVETGVAYVEGTDPPLAQQDIDRINAEAALSDELQMKRFKRRIAASAASAREAEQTEAALAAKHAKRAAAVAAGKVQ